MLWIYHVSFICFCCAFLIVDAVQYSNRWSIQIYGDMDEADRLARKHGFVNHGKAPMHVVLNNVKSLTKMDAEGLSAEPNVKMVQQQVIKLRKLLAQSTSDSAVWIPPRDAMWKDMWYIVTFVPRTLLLLAVFFHSVFSIQPKHLNLGIREDGSDFNEDIYIDEEKGKVLLRVPTHNNIDGASFLNDFNLGLTITRIPARKACHVSKMDPEFSKPVQLKEDLTWAASQRDEMSVVITRKSLLKVTGPANRSLLTKEILDFCGTFPIYNIETTEAHFRVKSNGDETPGRVIRHRVARQTVKKYMACTPNDPLKYIAGCISQGINFDLRCHYLVKCVNQQPRTAEWKCTRAHYTNYQPICCDLICS